MLDIKFIKENKDLVLKAIENKKGEAVDIDRMLEIYEVRVELLRQVETLNHKKNEAANARNVELGKTIKLEHQEVEDRLRKTEKEFIDLMIKIPNIPSPDTPIGKDENDNVQLQIRFGLVF